MNFDWSRVVRVNAVEPPVTLALAKSHIRDDGADEDELVDLYLQAATEWIEGPNGAGISIKQQTWDYYLDCFPCEIEIGLGPLVSVDSITYTDADGTADQTVATSVYEVDAERGLIRPKQGQSWPTVDTIYKAIRVRFDAGYSAIPADLKVAVLQLVAHQEAHREPVIDATLAEVPMSVRSIVERYRRGRFA